MTSESAQVMAQQAVTLVQGFFERLGEEERECLPTVLMSSGIWMTVSDARILAVFFLDESAQERIDRHKKKGWHPFPGFLISESQRPPDQRAAYHIHRPFCYYSSKRTANMFAFCVGPGASFTVVDHLHEVADTYGNRFTYTVDLALGLGLAEGEQWFGVKPRLSELLDHSISVWKGP